MPDNSIHHFTIEIAGLAVRINTLYSQTYWFCYNYLSNLTPDFEITISSQDLLEEQMIALDDNLHYQPSFCEPLAVYRKIVRKAIEYETILMHGATIAINHKGYIFSAKSGTGKTTHIMQWLEQAPGAVVINGDKPLIRYMNNQFFVCGTPWSGKEHMNTNMMVPLKAVVFMTRNENNSIAEIGFSQAFPFILSQIYMHDGIEEVNKTLDLLDRMKENIQFYHFLCNNFKKDSFQVSYNMITK